MRRTIAVSACVLLAGLAASLAFSQSGRGEKYAFLIVCSKYNNTRLKDLPYTIEEMEDFKKALLKTGFEADHIVMLHDKADRERVPEKAKIEKQFQMFLGGLQPADTAYADDPAPVSKVQFALQSSVSIANVILNRSPGVR